MYRLTSFPMAVMALSVSGFLFVASQSVAARLPWPWEPEAPPAAAPVIVCTADTQRCPDGRDVGRQAPACTFAPCPPADADTGMVVILTDANTHQPLKQATVSLISQHDVRCYAEPCPSNEQSWTSTTDDLGQLVVPVMMVDSNMRFQADGFAPQELHLSTTVGQAGRWSLAVSPM